MVPYPCGQFQGLSRVARLLTTFFIVFMSRSIPIIMLALQALEARF
jgi:hypothetical protein